MQNIKHMPIGIQSFETIRNNPYVYVDKTQFIPKLELVGRAYFLARPRRFGKSLFISTLQAYFEGRKELFNGLAIEKYKMENNIEWQTYPVLKLDLNAGEYTIEEHLTAILKDHINKWKTTYDIQFEITYPHIAFARIIEALYKKLNQKVVILVDEYDKPLIATLENKELQNQYRSTLKAFYSVIKSLNDYIHFSFLTGVTKFSKVSIFSDLNNLDDISFDRKYSSICGITEEELQKNFSPQVQALADEYNKSYDDMLKDLRRKYDGYRFSENEERIYNPFSLCIAFDKNRLGDYWFESGTPTFMMQLMEQNDFELSDLESNIRVNAKSIDDYRMDYANIIPLLFQAGYLTIKNYDENDGAYILGYPNDEVKYAFVYSLMGVYTNGKTLIQGEFRIGLFIRAMKKGEIDRLLTLIKALLASIPYDSFSKKMFCLREHNYQTAIYLIFCLMGQYVKTEVHSSKGRSDIEVETASGIYIFEFKVGGTPFDAIAQIKNAGYAEKYIASRKSIFLIGAIINQEERTLDSWHIEQLVTF